MGKPSYDIIDYWMPADALAGRCSVPQVGTLKPLEAPRSPSERQDVAEARLYVPRALKALVRVMETEEGMAAVAAAREILMRAYGPAQVVDSQALLLTGTGGVATGLPEHEGEVGQSNSPEWLNPSRFSYRQPGGDRGAH